MVKVIFYSAQKHSFYKSISSYLTRIFYQAIEFVNVYEISAVTCLVEQIGKNRGIVVLLASTVMELEALVNVKDKLSTVPLILILPDGSVETMQKGMRLAPLYYMTYNDKSGLASAVMLVSDIIMNKSDMRVNPNIAHRDSAKRTAMQNSCIS